MLDDRAWYLIARKHIEAIDGNEQKEELIGFAHFRFDMDTKVLQRYFKVW